MYYVADHVRKRGGGFLLKKNKKKPYFWEQRGNIQNYSGDGGVTSAAVARGRGKKLENKPRKTELPRKQPDIQEGSIMQFAHSYGQSMHIPGQGKNSPNYFATPPEHKTKPTQCFLVHSDRSDCQKYI